MYYCYCIKEGLFDEEKEYAKELGLYLFYDEKKDQFLDKADNIVDISDKKVFIRTGVYQVKSMFDAITRHNGKSLTKKGDFDKILNWPNYINTARKNLIISGQQIITNPQTIIDNFGIEKVFFKTKEKNYSGIIDVETIIDPQTPFHKAILAHLDDDFIISDVVEIEEDDIGHIEYRAFVVNNKLLNVSRVHDYLLGKIPKVVIEKYNEIIKKLKDTDFPDSYVLDLFAYKNKNSAISNLEILEFNPIESSGTYLYNSPFVKDYDLLHNCPSASLPQEKVRYWDMKSCSYSKVGKLVPSIIYNLPGGFAADIVSYSFFGQKTTKDSFFHMSFETLDNLDPANILPLTEGLDFVDSDQTFKKMRQKLLSDSNKG